MVVIAVAGGTGGLGRAIVDELSLSGKHTVKVFTRNRVINAETKANVSYVGVNYGDVDALVKNLEENGIHTVISTLSTLTKEVGESQMSLIKAAYRAETTKRFMPSEFGIICREEVAQDSILYWTKAQATAELRHSNLEFCLFSNGLFLDYFCGPSVRSYMPATPFIVDIPHRTATIPGDGQDIIIFTHTTDVAKYVVACLELPAWPEHAVAIGERMTWNQFVQTCEVVTGEKFNVSYITVDELHQRRATAASRQQSKSGAGEGESYSADVAQSLVWMARGFFDAPDELAINKIFPDIKPLTLKDVL